MASELAGNDTGSGPILHTDQLAGSVQPGSAEDRPPVSDEAFSKKHINGNCAVSNDYSDIMDRFFREGYDIPAAADRQKMIKAHSCDIEDAKPTDKLATTRELANKTLLEVTDDEYNYAMSPKAYADLQAQTHQRFGGLGMEVSTRPLDSADRPLFPQTAADAFRENQDKTLNWSTIVEKPFPGDPAAKAGLQANDVISAVDKENTLFMPLDKVVDKLRGPVGTDVDVSVLRDGKPLQFHITRQTIIPKSVEGPFYKGEANDIAYIQTKMFGDNTADELGAALKKAIADKPNLYAFIIDFRQNRGGLVDQAIQSSQYFLKGNAPGGNLIMTEQQRQASPPEHPVYQGTRYAVDAKRARETDFSSDDPDHPTDVRPGSRRSYLVNGKLVIALTDDGSASASEIVLGALSDNHVITTIGEPTFGKGIVQCINEGPGHAAAGMKLTCGRYFNPSGWWPGDANKHRHPRQPDIYIAASPDLTWGIVKRGSADDNQLNAAVFYADTRHHLNAAKKQGTP